MADIEKLLNDLYETLLQLRYPGLAQGVSRNTLESTVLAEENRLFLLSWILEQCPFVKPEEFTSEPNQQKIIKCYCDIGICSDANTLMGRVPIHAQVSTLKNLLFFLSNAPCADRSETRSKDSTKIIDIYKKCASRDVNIIASSLGLKKKFMYKDAVRYLERRGSFCDPKNSEFQEKVLADDNNSECDKKLDRKEREKRKECIKEFIESFATLSQPEVSSKPVPERSMDNVIDVAFANMGMLKNTFQSQNEILHFTGIKRLEQPEMLLDGTIADVVIAIEALKDLANAG